MSNKVVDISLEEKARFEVWDSDHSMVMGDADVYDVREHIEGLLWETDFNFDIILQEGFHADTENFLIYMHSENWEDHLTDDKISACENQGFTKSNDTSATKSILDYLGISVIFSHYVKEKDQTEEKSETISMEKGFLYMTGNEGFEYAFTCVSDGTYYAYKGTEGIEVLITDPYHDSSLYVRQKEFSFEYDSRRVEQINELFDNDFNKTIETLVEYLILFRNTLMATQFARTTINDEEVKECTDAIFSNPIYKTLELETDEGQQKLYDLQCIEYQKRDETYSIPFSVDNPNWSPKDIIFNVKVKILKPIKFSNPYAQEVFGPRYAGEPGDVILMSDQHFLYFRHNGFVEFASETTSGEAVSGAQMVLDGFSKCEDDSVWTELIEYADTAIIATDLEGKHHIFDRHGNDWFSYWEEA